MKDCETGLALRFWRDQLWTRLSGRKVRFTRTVERDEFTVPAGRVGTIRTPFLDSKGGLVLAVQLRTAVQGSEEFEGEVHWREGVNIEEVEDDIQLL